MAARSSPVRWLLILLAVGLIGVGSAAAVWWATRTPSPAGGPATTVEATVVDPALCSVPNAQDGVSFTVNGKQQRGRLDGCGHHKDDKLQVEVPAQFGAAADTAVRLPGTGTGAGESGLASRLEPVLLALSAVAGGAYAYLIARPFPRTRRRAGT